MYVMFSFFLFFFSMCVCVCVCVCSLYTIDPIIVIIVLNYTVNYSALIGALISK